MHILEKINNDIKSLPTLPVIFESYSTALKDPNINFEKLSKIISVDQASVMQLLKIANSPFYGFRGHIDSVSKALMYLGVTEVQNIIYATTIVNAMPALVVDNKFLPTDFWNHSIAVGVVARIVGNSIGEKNLENLFLAGILHDIGKLVLMNYAPVEYKNVISHVHQNKISIKKAEFDILGFDHTNVGKLLAEKWKLPTVFINVIHYHHLGLIGGYADKTVALIHIADIVARLLALGNAGDETVPEPNIKVWDVLNVSPKLFSNLRVKIEEEYTEITSLITR